MGSLLMRRPPKYVHAFLDRHGKVRFYFRRRGFKRTPLPGLPWSPEFMAAYEAALAAQPQKVGRSRTRPGTMGALAVSYFNSTGFRNMAASTQGVYRNIIERFCSTADQDGHPCAGICNSHHHQPSKVPRRSCRHHRSKSRNLGGATRMGNRRFLLGRVLINRQPNADLDVPLNVRYWG